MRFEELFIILILPALIVALLIFNYCVIRQNFTEMSIKLNKSKAETKKLYQERLQKAEALCEKEELSISIRTFEYSFSKDMLNANSTFPRIITISPEWIKKLLSDEPYWDVAFIQTIGHELAHKKNEPKPIYWVNKKAIFTNWSRECRADFYGVEFAEKYLSNETRATIISAMRRKYTPSDVSTLTHPSWNLRYSLLIDQKHLNIKVFEEIGAKVGYSDNSYISEIAGKSMNFNLNDNNI